MKETIKRYVRDFVFRLRGDHTTEHLIKMGMKVGKNFNRLNGVILDPAHCWLIEIGDNVTLAPRVHVLAHDASTKMFLDYAKIGRVIIGNNVFVGANSVILPNVKIGDNTIIGANSTVTKDLKGGYVYAGSPARAICPIEEYLEKNRKMMETAPVYGDEYTTRENVDKTKKDQMIHDLSDGWGFVK